MHRNMAVLLGIGLILVGCFGDKPPRTTTVEFAQPERGQVQELGSEIRIKLITATGSHEEMQAEVQGELDSFINGGQYEIVRVVTTRCYRDSAHLLSAEVYYRPKK